MVPSRFRDRGEAGRRLARALRRYELPQPIVLALPRGGVPVGYEVARALGAPLDIWVVRKLGVPWQPELGVGAVAEGGHVYLARDLIAELGLSEQELSRVVSAKSREVEERVASLRGGRAAPALAGRSVILVDDGIATGGTVRAALGSIRAQHPARIVLAVPVVAVQTLKVLNSLADRVVALLAPAELYAIGLWYEEFEQVSDEEVVRLLERARREAGAERAPVAGASEGGP